MEKFEAYLGAFDGSPGWAEVEPLFDDAFHPDLVVVTADGELDKDQWKAMAEGLAERGAVVSDFEVKSEDAGSAYYKVTISVEGEEPMHLTAKAALEDGRLLRVEPVDPAAYSDLVDHSR
jgi:hypothetical protein